MENNAEFRRELIKAGNRSKYGLSATEVADLLDWFEHMPGEIFNELLHANVSFPDGYIDCWKDNREKEAIDTDSD